MKFKCIVEYEYPTEHKPPVKAEIVLHGDRVVTDKIIQLPKEHGDLIDSDILCEKYEMTYDFYQALDLTPIIIEEDYTDEGE